VRQREGDKETDIEKERERRVRGRDRKRNRERDGEEEGCIGFHCNVDASYRGREVEKVKQGPGGRGSGMVAVIDNGMHVHNRTRIQQNT
jgi:hypothetical protein